MSRRMTGTISLEKIDPEKIYERLECLKLTHLDFVAERNFPRSTLGKLLYEEEGSVLRSTLDRLALCLGLADYRDLLRDEQSIEYRQIRKRIGSEALPWFWEINRTMGLQRYLSGVVEERFIRVTGLEKFKAEMLKNEQCGARGIILSPESNILFPDHSSDYYTLHDSAFAPNKVEFVASDGNLVGDIYLPDDPEQVKVELYKSKSEAESRLEKFHFQKAHARSHSQST